MPLETEIPVALRATSFALSTFCPGHAIRLDKNVIVVVSAFSHRTGRVSGSTTQALALMIQIHIRANENLRGVLAEDVAGNEVVCVAVARRQHATDAHVCPQHHRETVSLSGFQAHCWHVNVTGVEARNMFRFVCQTADRHRSDGLTCV